MITYWLPKTHIQQNITQKAHKLNGSLPPVVTAEVKNPRNARVATNTFNKVSGFRCQYSKVPGEDLLPKIVQFDPPSVNGVAASKGSINVMYGESKWHFRLNCHIVSFKL